MPAQLGSSAGAAERVFEEHIILKRERSRLEKYFEIIYL
jgi:hypothetical protein